MHTYRNPQKYLLLMLVMHCFALFSDYFKLTGCSTFCVSGQIFTNLNFTGNTTTFTGAGT